MQFLKPVKRMVMILAIVLCCIGCDQASKTAAARFLSGTDAVRLLKDVVRLQYIENSGGFLSLGAGIPETWRYLVFTLVVGVFISGLLIYTLAVRKLSTWQTIGLSLVVGGGFGNLIDRIFNQGLVIDFINLGIGPLRTGIFNVADLVIAFGSVWLIVTCARAGKSRQAQEKM
jgi:signal peptidase II